jgi:glycerol-3-phosphate acyltransferase PlsY
MNILITALTIVAAYLLGSLSSAILICRLTGLPDPRNQGSGNPGATNVLRFGGKKLAAIVLLGDMLKGLLPAILAVLFALPAETIAAVGLAAFAGHLYPLFFAFRGGKGVATAVGVILALSWPTGLALIVTWLGISLLLRISSLAAICSALLAPVYMWWFEAVPVYVAAVAIMSLALIWRHRTNIRNLLNGEEPRIGQKKGGV